MHICIPDTREVRPQHGASYLLYNVHIDGLYHCSLRYKQLLHLHQSLTKKFNSSTSDLSHPLPSFPPKKLLPLSASRVEERRQQLEKYLQNISQDKTISNSTIFNMFLLEAQRESTRLVEPEEHVNLDIELVNGHKIRLPIVTHDSVYSVLTACCRALGLDDRYHAYFCLCLCGYDVVRDKLIIKRKLSFFEAPFITLQVAIQQQEQLQSVLSTELPPPLAISSTVDGNNNSHERHTSLSPATTTGTTLRYSSNINPCHCLSCSQQQQIQQKQSPTTTGVPFVSSSRNNLTYADQQSLANHQYYQSNCNVTGHQARGSGRFRGASSPFVTHRILLRKSYWDPIYDSYILNDGQALNLLFIQTVYDMKHSLMFVDRDTYQQLESLLASDSKLEYILLARTLKYYNYVHFEPCYSDYPRPKTKVMISIGSRELNMRVLKAPKSSSSTNGVATNGSSSTSHHQHLTQQQRQEPVLYCTSSLIPNGFRNLVTKDDLIEEEYNFKVPLIRCWRLTSMETLNSSNQHQNRSTATTTLAGRKRKSLSLFSSVVGNSVTNSNQSARDTIDVSHTSHRQGYGGQSLMATLMSSGNQQQDHASGRISTSIGSNSFFNFRRNGNQSSNLNDNNNNNAEQNQFYQQENHNAHCREQQQMHQSLTDDLMNEQTQLSHYELSFEYLIAKDTLKWITISSDQAIFISISLQGVVDELVSKRDLGACLGNVADLERADVPSGHDPGNNQSLVSRPISIRQRDTDTDNKQQLSESFTYMYQDGGQKLIKSKSQQMLDKFCNGNSPPSIAANYSQSMARQQRIATSADGSFGGYTTSLQSHSSSSNLHSVGIWSSGLDASSGRHPYGQSTSSTSPNNSGGFITSASSHEISQFNNRKIPSPIINDAFEGLVTNDDNL